VTSTDAQVLELRDECRNYPRPVLAAALERALVGSEMADQAFIIAACLTDPDANTDDCPPLSPALIARVRRELRLLAR
jgi:hypothetical protein